MTVAQIDAANVLPASSGGLWHEAWSRLRKNPGAIVGCFIVGTFVVIAIFAPLLAPYSPKLVNLNAIGTSCCPGPSAQHWFGVDQLGRDEFSRILYGARYSLIIGVVAVAAGLTLGLLFGAVAGYFGGFLDSLIMRCMDVMLAIPGHANTVTVSTAPESSRPVCRPMIVEIGSIAFRSTCRESTSRGGKPFARAVRT